MKAPAIAALGLVLAGAAHADGEHDAALRDYMQAEIVGWANDPVIVAAIQDIGGGIETRILDEVTADLAGTPERPAVRVTVATPEPRMVTDGVSAIGTVYAQRSVELRPLVSGRVEEVLVESGAEVAAGAPIIRLDDRAEQAALARAEAALADRREPSAFDPAEAVRRLSGLFAEAGLEI